MKSLSIITIVTFISGIYSDYYASILWSEMYGHYRAFLDIWLPTMPYSIYWFSLIICAWKNWRIILLGMPIVTFNIFHLSFWYIYNYHTNMGNLYYPGQILALFQVVTMIIGMILFVLDLIVLYKKYERKLLQSGKF